MTVHIPAPEEADGKAARTRIEFRHALQNDSELPTVRHLVNLFDENRKPIPTADNLPDKKEWSWTDFWPDLAPGAPVEVEIGAGKGNFMVEYAQKRPELRFVGIEIEPKYAKYGGSRLFRNHIPNAISLRGDALLFLRDYVPENSVSAFHMYQPDPWPKERQRRRRLLRPEFLDAIFRAARPGNEALFHWSTDFKEYDERAQEMFAETPFLELVQNDAPPTWGIMTNFEKKYRLEGRPIYRSVVRILKEK